MGAHRDLLGVFEPLVVANVPLAVFEPSAALKLIFMGLRPTAARGRRVSVVGETGGGCSSARGPAGS